MSLPDGVGGVYLPPVIGIQVAQRSVDAAGRPHGVGVSVPALAQDQDVDALPGKLDGRPEPRRTGANDQYIRLYEVAIVLATVPHAIRLP